MTKQQRPIHTPPDRAELEKLPWCALIAYAGRCARRVEPLFSLFWPQATSNEIDSLRTAIKSVEQIGSGLAGLETQHAAHIAREAIKHTVAIANVKSLPMPALTVVHAVTHASYAATYLAEVARGRKTGLYTTIRSVEESIEAAIAAVDNGLSLEAARTLVPEIRRDLNLIVSYAAIEKWNDYTPVAPDFFGPLWPEGAPKGWPEEELIEPQAIKVQFSVPRGMSDEESREYNSRVKNVLVALSALDASMGGTGLQILDDESSEPVIVEEEQPLHQDAACAGVNG